MITLSSERGYEKVETWAEIQELAGFSENLDPKEHQLKEIIGRYIFKDYISCGLSSCHQPHGKGYIVSTKSGPVTNIGNGCGKTHFGVDFKVQSRKFDRDLAEHNYRESLGSFLFRIDEYASNLQQLRNQDKGADWVNRSLKSLVQKNRGCTGSVVEKVVNMVKARNSTITYDREATKQEREDLEEIEKRKISPPHYIEEQGGILSDLSALYSENDLRELLVMDLQENLKLLEKVDIDSAEFKELKHWSEWCSTYEQNYEKCVDIVASGLRLLSSENLLQLNIVITDKDDKKAFKEFVENLQ